MLENWKRKERVDLATRQAPSLFNLSPSCRGDEPGQGWLGVGVAARVLPWLLAVRVRVWLLGRLPKLWPV